MGQPRKKVITVVCGECGQDWKAHGNKPTLEDCVRLLKKALAEANRKPHFMVYNGPQSGTMTSTATPAILPKREAQ